MPRTQQDYEDRQNELLQAIERAQQALWSAESGRAPGRVRMNREDALRQAEDEYNHFMEHAHEAS